ncbi:MAG: aminotransferase class I/II-fold pyridoxal phosphate-dependent enzyme [Gemmatimonadetes bacterium]|nr:aminotransferase class I/II-fold pyridoxal phosphate-dependent enzyme [Gemmatimonadota bacterium]NIQ55442.1 aminotransferase class I/II-fold pyridoxal phosphate-dependent enzyme [Gemmatimonadota bacterium]NIU75650.1 aminotransferase class I/II-fold pyridoxal phosphate-dependent enzyme [Gammaproteobacteria bacterium]NIX45325.1 aminotransferase class I/II-fold pyridoxal phosphate-dependent enzyme [Gemmatimonadota bacterium]NIY09608.1 aminotransferase class I/II-fold pyridoxal phosphate-depende
MPLDKLIPVLDDQVTRLDEENRAKGEEAVVTRVLKPEGDRGPRVMLRGEGERQFLRMNSNSYLGMGLRPEVIEAEEAGSTAYGAGPGAVRFISGTYEAHIELESRLAAFHGREAAMIFSSAYATVMGVLTPLITPETVVVSDELNHNCIINAMRLARPADKVVYPHLDMDALDRACEEAAGRGRRLMVVTDGIFSMRGDHAPLDEIVRIAGQYDARFEEGAFVVVDDSHGVGAFGDTGRGTEEYTGAHADLLVGTLGKAFGVNGGYIVGPEAVIRFLRETSPFYIYSNPITPGEARAAATSLEILDSPLGKQLLEKLRSLTSRFESGLDELGFETIPGEHPVVPLMVRDTATTRALVRHLHENGVLATGLAYPVVPKGDEEIRFQVNADHTEADIDRVLEILAAFEDGTGE